MGYKIMCVCVCVCVCVCAGVFPSAWYSSVREIASRSPLLLLLGTEKFVDKELEINHPLKIENIATVRNIVLYISCIKAV